LEGRLYILGVGEVGFLDDAVGLQLGWLEERLYILGASDDSEVGLFDKSIGAFDIDGWALGFSLVLNNPKPHDRACSPSSKLMQMIVLPDSGSIVFFSIPLITPPVPRSLTLTAFSSFSFTRWGVSVFVLSKISLNS